MRHAFAMAALGGFMVAQHSASPPARPVPRWSDITGHQPGVGAPTLGVVLNGLLANLGNVINGAQNAGSIFIVGAAGQVQQAVLSARAAYHQELDLTLDKLTGAQQNAVNGLITQVSTLQQQTADNLKQLAERGSTIANTIPFSNTLPQVMRYAPSYVAP